MSGYPHPPVEHGAERYATSKHATWVSVWLNLLLTVAQIVIGFIGQSQALIADGFHTLSDLVTDFMVLFALAHGHKAADAEHPYGHARIETAMTLILGGMLVAVGLGIALNAGLKLQRGELFVIPSQLTLWVAVFTLVAKELLYRYLIAVANRYDSNMLRANAWHSRSDAISSLVVVIGIGGSLIGFAYLDSAAAVIVAVMVVKIGFDLARQALRELVDTGLSADDLVSVRRSILAVNGVNELHLLRTRRVGGQVLVDVHIIVDDRLSVSEGHQISETVRARLMRDIAGVADVMVHIDIEEDIQGASCAHLPLRDEVLARLARHFLDIPQAGAIEQTLLHYRNGRIDVELLLTLDAVTDTIAARELAARFANAVRGDSEFGKIEVRYH